MAQNQINLADKSTVELKAFAYDLKVVIEQYTQLFQVVNQEIANRNQAQQAGAAVAVDKDEVPTPPSNETDAPAPQKVAKKQAPVKSLAKK